jgi:isocitrate/isopropylmalate dehydrogenase
MKREYKIGIIPGDGIGRDVVDATQSVLAAVNHMWEKFTMTFFRMDVGESAIEKYGDPLPKATLDAIGEMDASLFGAAHTQPVIPGLRVGFDLYAKVCPIRAWPGTEVIRPDADLIVVRENTEGSYRGVGYIDGDTHVNLRIFTQKGMERIIRFSFDLAVKQGRKKVTFTHKAPVFRHTDAPMRQIFYETAKQYPGVEAEDMMVDACAMTMIMKPERLDIILCENGNGDILCDVGAGITGGLGLQPSGNIGDSMAIFEPVHGTAPKYAGKNVVNPIAAILAGKMMLDYLGETAAGFRLEKAVGDVLLEGKVRTYDLCGNSSTKQVAEAISEKIMKDRKRRPLRGRKGRLRKEGPGLRLFSVLRCFPV